MHGTKGKVPASFPPGPFFVGLIVTILRSPDASGRPGYQDGRHPVAPAQQAPGGHACPGPEAQDGGHTPIPARSPRSAAPRSSGAGDRAAAASRDRRCGLRPAPHSPRRGGRGRHWRGAGATTGRVFCGVSSSTSPRAWRSSAWAGIGSSSIRGIRGARTGPRSACGGMKVSGVIGSCIATGAMSGSGNSVGFCAIGRTVTSP
ncbi:hypothetical protein ACVW0J_003548 [Bradyrhizobium sp. i1.7.7]